jgi:hypothetical protein
VDLICLVADFFLNAMPIPVDKKDVLEIIRSAIESIDPGMWN